MRIAILCFAGLTTSACLARENIATREPSPQACPAVQVEKGPTPPQCVQISGEDVGRLPLELRLGDHTAIHLAEWTQVDEASHGFVGFAAHLPANVVYAVKAGDVYFSGRDARWLHPAGLTGPRVHRIEAVSFCRVLATRCGGTPVMVDSDSPPSAGVGVVASR